MSLSEQDIKNSWLQVGQRFADDNPAFVKTWNHVLFNSRPWQVHPYVNPVAQLIGYLRSLMYVCQQSLYSIEQINELRDKEQDNINTWYVSLHFYDFIARVKTATDLLALLIRHIFAIDKTKLPDEHCSLHTLKISGILSSQNPTPLKKNLAVTLKESKEEWIEKFYPLRNFVVHQPGFLFTGPPYNTIHPAGSYIYVPFPYKNVNSSITFDRLRPLESLKPLADAGEPLSVFLRQIESTSLNHTNHLMVEPLTLCEEIWVKLSHLIDKVITQCHPQIFTFLTDNEDIGKP